MVKYIKKRGGDLGAPFGEEARMEKKIISKSGIPVYSYTNAAQGSFFLSLYLRSGSMHEETSGITHFFEHIAIRNINYRMSGELYSVLDRYGLEFNAATAQDNVQFYISGARQHVRLGAEILVRVLDEITLPREEIDRERGRIRAEIRETGESHTLAGFSAERVFAGSTLARPITGTLGSVAKIGIRALDSFRKEVLTAENLFFYATGNVTEEDLIYLADLADGYKLPRGEGRGNTAPVPTYFGKRGAAVHIKGADFTKLRFTFDVDTSRVSLPELDLVYDQLLGGYSSELFMELSERRGMIYDLGGGVERYENLGVFSFNFEIKEAHVAEAVSLIVDILRRHKEELLPEKSIVRAGYVDNAMMLFDDPRELNFTFAYDNHIMRCGYGSIEDRRAAYADVSPERIREACRALFCPENLTLALKGSRKRIDAAAIRKILLGL